MENTLPRLPYSTRLLASLALAALLLTACASANSPTQTPDGGAPTPAATVPETAPPIAEPSVTAAPTSTLTGTTPTPFATPRGDELEATDPDTVMLAMGGPQVVEFFAFW